MEQTQAYCRLRASGLFSGAHEVAVGLLRSRLCGAIIVLMGSAGALGALVTFWPL